MYPAITDTNDPNFNKVGAHSFNTVSPDGKWLLYTDLGEAGSRITLVENFH